MAKSAGMTLGVNLALNTQGLAADAQKAVGEISRLGVSINKVGVSAVAAGTAIGTFAANVVMKVASLVKTYSARLAELVKKQFEVVDSLAKMGDRFGLMQSEMAAFSLAARLNGSSIESVATALQKMQKTIGEAGSGGKTATAALTQLGLAASMFNGRTAAESFGVIAERIKGLDSAALRAKATMDIFGKGGAELAPLILAGAAGIEEATLKTQEYGTALSEIDVAKIEAAGDAWEMVAEKVNGIATAISRYVAPAVYGIADAFLKYVGPSIGNIMDFAVGKLGLFLRVSESLFGVLRIGWAGVKNIIGQPITFIGALVTELIAVIGRLWERLGGAPDLKNWAEGAAKSFLKVSNDLRKEFGEALDKGIVGGKESKWERALIEATATGKKALGEIAESAAKAREEIRDMNRAAADLEDAIEPVKEPKAEKISSMKAAAAAKTVKRASQAIPQLAGGLVAGSASAANIINRSGDNSAATRFLGIQESMLRKVDQVEVTSRRFTASLEDWIRSQVVVQF